MTALPERCPLCGDLDRGGHPPASTAVAPFLRPRPAVSGFPTADEVTALRRAIAGRLVEAHYQPIVHLESGGVVGHEALARCALDALPTPDVLFRVARQSDEVTALDWECARAGLAGADSVLHPDDVLFLNAEPSTLGLLAPAEVVELFTARAAAGRLVVEISERSVLVNPAQLLNGIRNMRDLGASIALDDVGASADSLALMPFVDPDIIKLDMSVIHGSTTLEVARLLRAVHSQVERTGAAILAEGIETEEHLAFATGLGATLGQGWLFGRPRTTPAPAEMERGPAGAVPRVEPVSDAPTPFAAIPAGTRTSVGGAALLRAVSHDLEDMAAYLPSAPVVLVSLQRGAAMTPTMAATLRHLARSCTFVGISADELDGEHLEGVRVASRPLAGPGRDEWAVVVISSHFSGALLARELEPGVDTGSPQFEYVISHDRQTVVRAGASLLRTITEA